MGFAENLRKMRKQMGWTQIDLGIKSDINPKTLSSYEQGRTEPSLGEVVKLCKVFDCSIAHLTDTKENEPGDVTVEDILLKLGSLEPSVLIKIQDTIDRILHDRREIEEIMKEKAFLEEQLAIYNERIKKLEGK